MTIIESSSGRSRLEVPSKFKTFKFKDFTPDKVTGFLKGWEVSPFEILTEKGQKCSAGWKLTRDLGIGRQIITLDTNYRQINIVLKVAEGQELFSMILADVKSVRCEIGVGGVVFRGKKCELWIINSGINSLQFDDDRTTFNF